MGILDFKSLSLGANLAIFGVAAVFVWVAGTRLAYYADAIGARKQLSRAFLGLILLGVATSLPEIATTITASLLGNAGLVSGNLFGGVALQVAVLAVVDFVAVRGALTFFTPPPVLLFQGVMLVLLLALALAGATAGEPIAFLGLGLTPILLFAGYLLTVRLSASSEYFPRWRATNEPDDETEAKTDEGGRLKEFSDTRLYLSCLAGAAVIFVCGWALARTGDALAEQTELGATFVGVGLVAFSTSLPELSTSLAAVRQGNHQMAVSNILGTNCLEVALFLLADAVYRGGPILAATDQQGVFAGVLGIVVTCLYLLGLLERRDRTVFGVGLDSLGVAIAYPAGLVALYFLS